MQPDTTEEVIAYKALQVVISLNLGDVLRAIGKLDESKYVLEEILKEVKSFQDTKIKKAESAILLNLGNTFRAIGNLERDRRSSPVYDYMPWHFMKGLVPGKALDFYRCADSYYQQAIDKSTSSTTTRIKAQLNRLSLLLDMLRSDKDNSDNTELGSKMVGKDRCRESEMKGRGEKGLPMNATWYKDRWRKTAKTLSEEIKISDLPPGKTRIYARINLSKNLAYLQQESNQDTPSYKKIINQVKKAIKEAKELEKGMKNKYTTSYALGNLGGLYEYLASQLEKPQQQKKALNKQVCENAQECRDKAEQLTRDALYLAQPNEAPDIAYQWQWQLGRLKVQSKKTQEAIANYKAAVKTLESVRGDLLAINSDVQFSFRDNVEPVYRELVDLLLKPCNPSNQSLKKATELIDSLQLAELDNFLRCRLTKTLQVDKITDQKDPTAAIFYPVILKDRLEVILKIPGQKELKHYKTPYKTPLDINNLEYIINQLRNHLSAQTSGADEYQPCAKKIYDALIQQAEEKQYLNKEKIKTLVFVLDGSLRKIPISALWDGEHFLIEKYAVAVTPSLNILGPKPLEGNQLKVLAAGFTQESTVTIGDKKITFNSLKNVSSEIETIKKIFPNSTIIKDNNFTIEQLIAQLKNDDYPIIHLATHGQFSINPKETFILESSNSVIDVNELQKILIIGKQSKPNSIQFLVFSACETAKGDRRAILGMAGIAIRAGANSTMATLWLVNDKSTAFLIEKFYQNLKGGLEQKQINKAEALKKAQLSLRQSSDFSHPYFWSPFVIVGNWL